MKKRNISVFPIGAEDARPFIMRVHYARRMPMVQYAYGLFVDGVLRGCVTYGKPASPYLCVGVCGKENSQYVYELNRLCLEQKIDNGCSLLVSKSIRLLPKPMVLVSYADSGAGHIGYVYQSTNWIYTGKTDDERKTPRGDRRSAGLHGRHSYDENSDIVRRSKKHRYIYFVGSKKQIKEFETQLMYKKLPYPKGETRRYPIEATEYRRQLLPGFAV